MLRTALRGILAHKARQIMTVLAVCLGVAFVSGALVFADSTTAAHRAAASKSFAGIAVTVTPKASPSRPAAHQEATALDDALARRLADVPGVAAVRPAADGTATMNAADGTPLRAGKTWANLGAAYVPGPDGKDARHPLAEGRAPRNSGELAVDRGTAAAGHLRLGEAVTLATDGPVMTKRLVGIVTTDDTRVTAGGTLALFDKATAQKLYASPGHYTGIDLSAAPGTSAPDLARRVTDVLPADRAEAVTGAAQADQQSVLVDTLTRGYAKLPLVFAGVSLFVGSFLVVNTFTMLVARRTREIALLRAIGASRRQVSRSVLLEALLVGLIASATGFLLGLGVASVLPDVLSTGGDRLPRGPLVIGPASVVAALGVGVGVTVLAAWLPSRRAARVAPIEALRTAAQPPSAARTRVRGAAGLVLLAVGAGWLVSLTGARDASEDNLRSAMFGCALFVVGLTVLAPLLAAPVIRLAGRLTGRFGVIGKLARENALRDPRRTAATAATLMVSTALVAGLAVIGHSTGQALDRQAAAGLGADYVISSRTPTAAIDPGAVRRVAEAPGVRTASAVTDSTLFVGGGVREISGVDPRTVNAVMKLDFVSGSGKDIGPGRIAVSATFAREQGVRTGGRIAARTGQSQRVERYTVVGVYQDNPVARDALGARSDVARDSLVPGSVQRILVRTDGGTVSEAAERRLRTAVGDSPLLTVRDRPQLVREAAGTMADLLNVVYGMLAIGVVIGALGIVNTLAMSVTERTHEIGALRALGMDRAGVRRMIRVEAVTVAAFGTALGLAGGLFAAWAVGSLANGALEQYSLRLPWGTLLLICLLSLTAGALAATAPARRAAALSPLEAVAEA
ncbi:ABC transporter permease [Streptomyces spectabilis]|uniref:ABC transporter permease n=1 Tax=Streptomyces spectabilis TaxID=68270 RepID=A0A5P2X4B0_STRST|nr:FtsX-like permease family protein [Streptomyces spectabilis]MBB5101212.1 putative ABC transport system permease protein [Streptomyces spectabilis]MCI3900414.1 FtsX-like permease family protein [Streptomyces spectabilis]QEV57995.1 ABC transporter permease [Streptomyces spectabilis]GGV10051.1 ABC transporter [Streptomyces spectabilis]